MEHQHRIIRRAIRRQSFCTLATASASARPLVTGVLYAAVEDVLYVSSLATSAKVRNIRANEQVGVCIPVRRVPVGPPFAVQFQGTAAVLAIDEPEVVEQREAGRLARISSHGELDHRDACVVRIRPGARIATYGLGVPLRVLLRDPLQGSRSVAWPTGGGRVANGAA